MSSPEHGSPSPHPVTGSLHVSPVPPGTGWPEDPADAGTPVATSAEDVRRLAAEADLDGLTAAAVIIDDSRVISLTVEKVYAEVPGASICVSEVPA